MAPRATRKHPGLREARRRRLEYGQRLAGEARGIDFEGLGFEEIGEMIGRNEVAARKRFSRALAELRRLMEPVWEGSGEDGNA